MRKLRFLITLAMMSFSMMAFADMSLTINMNDKGKDELRTITAYYTATNRLCVESGGAIPIPVRKSAELALEVVENDKGKLEMNIPYKHPEMGRFCKYRFSSVQISFTGRSGFVSISNPDNDVNAPDYSGRIDISNFDNNTVISCNKLNSDRERCSLLDAAGEYSGYSNVLSLVVPQDVIEGDSEVELTVENAL